MEPLFVQLPGNSRVWIYQSSRRLNDDESQQATRLVKDFVNQWTSHSQKVIAEGAVVYNFFIVLAADEAAVAVGGCSIDSTFHFIRQIEEQFRIRLFDRTTVAYRDNGAIKTAGQQEFQKMLDEKLVNSDTSVFNNLVATVDEFNRNWETPLSKSWHARLFGVVATPA